jgi:uncharacterized repeat protein (TIGR03943 family)
VNRAAQATVLFLIGAAMVHGGVTDLYLRYVKAELRPLLLVAGLVLIVAAIATAWHEWRHKHQDRDHGHREPRISWLLLLPLAALVLVAPPALGSYSAVRTGTALQPLSSFTALPAGGPLQLSATEYAGRAVYDHGRALADRPITITGFVAFDENGEPYLTRMVRNCCAADAQPVKIGLSGQVPPLLQPDTWLEVTGTYTSRQTTDPINSGPIPFIDISQARPVTAPADEYESW